jgi:hypothetical protein
VKEDSVTETVESPDPQQAAPALEQWSGKAYPLGAACDE